MNIPKKLKRFIIWNRESTILYIHWSKMSAVVEYVQINVVLTSHTRTILTLVYDINVPIIVPFSFVLSNFSRVSQVLKNIY